MALFAQRIGNTQERIYEIRIPCADGREALYRLCVDSAKERAFQRACKQGMKVNLTDFGRIVESRFIPGTLIIQPVSG